MLSPNANSQSRRLNSKVQCRNVAVNDLVKDLSDGVGHFLAGQHQC